MFVAGGGVGWGGVCTRSHGCVRTRVRACVRACVICLHYTIIIFDHNLIMIIIINIILYFIQIRHPDDSPQRVPGYCIIIYLV